MQPSSTIRDVAVDGLRFRIRSSPGPVADGDARPAVLLHGLGMSHRSMSRLQARMAPRRPVHSVELPGFGGRRPPRRPLATDALAEALGLALDHLHVRDAIVVGQSLGAQWATELAAQRPDLTATVVLIGPVVDDRRPGRAPLAVGVIADFLREPPALSLTMLADVLRTDPRWFFAQAEAMLRFPMLERLGRIEPPVLVLGGGRETVARHPWLRRVRGVARNGSLVVVPSAAHHPQFTAPGAVADAIEAFLAEAR